MDKIKAFFQNKITRIVSLVLFVLSVVSLIIGGITAEELNGAIVAVLAVLTAIGGLIALIGNLLHKG